MRIFDAGIGIAALFYQAVFIVAGIVPARKSEPYADPF
jgi:hypothetical protein